MLNHQANKNGIKTSFKSCVLNKELKFNTHSHVLSRILV